MMNNAGKNHNNGAKDCIGLIMSNRSALKSTGCSN